MNSVTVTMVAQAYMVSSDSYPNVFDLLVPTYFPRGGGQGGVKRLPMSKWEGFQSCLVLALCTPQLDQLFSTSVSRF